MQWIYHLNDALKETGEAYLECETWQTLCTAQQKAVEIFNNPYLSPSEKEFLLQEIQREVYNILQNIDNRRRNLEILGLLNELAKNLGR